MGKELSLNVLEIAKKVQKLEEAGGGGGSSESASKADIATEFDATKNYTAGGFVYHEGKLYQFNNDHAAGAWDSTDVVEANVTDQIVSNKAAIDELMDKPSVSVTADGVKNYARLLNDLFTATDIAKLSSNSKMIRITSTATIVYHLVEYTRAAMYFSYDVVTAAHWQILTFIMKNNDSGYRQVDDGSKIDKSSEVPDEGTILRIYY